MGCFLYRLFECLYEDVKNNKLNVIVDSTNQMPVENPDIVIDKEEAVKILVDGTDIAGGSNSSTEEPKEPTEDPVDPQTPTEDPVEPQDPTEEPGE